MLGNSAMERMFSHKQSKIDLFALLNSGNPGLTDPDDIPDVPEEPDTPADLVDEPPTEPEPVASVPTDVAPSPSAPPRRAMR